MSYLSTSNKKEFFCELVHVHLHSLIYKILDESSKELASL